MNKKNQQNKNKEIKSQAVAKNNHNIKSDDAVKKVMDIILEIK